jgi:hypothetical protein
LLPKSRAIVTKKQQRYLRQSIGKQFVAENGRLVETAIRGKQGHSGDPANLSPRHSALCGVNQASGQRHDRDLMTRQPKHEPREFDAP